MASAGVSSKPETSMSYFCHQCQAEVLPTEDITCSQCHSGAIEELESQRQAEQEEPVDTFPELWQDLHRDRRRRNQGHYYMHRRSRQAHNRGPHSQVMVSFGGSGGGSSGSGGSGGGNHNIMMSNNNGDFDRFVQQLFGNIGVQIMRSGINNGADGGGYQMAGTLGDYAWGPNGLDNVITQLLNQLDNSGPPPAEKSKIESLPVYKIEQKDIDENAECAVCRDVFELDESVKKLPCDHKFHQPCIDPWLELHDSCPICRCNLNGERSRDDS